MAKLVVCAVFDTALQAFMRPSFWPARGMAVRAFMDAIADKSDKDSPLSKHPQDYTLYFLGEFDEESGQFKQSMTPEQLIRGSDGGAAS